MIKIITLILNYLFEILKITIPAAVSVGIIMLARYYEKQREAETKIRDKKIKIYEKFVNDTTNFLFNSADCSTKKQNQLQANLTKTFEEFHKNIMFWGTDEIIEAYNKFRSRLDSTDARMEDFEDLILAFRKDVGHPNKNLPKYSILKLILRPDEFDKKGKPKKSTAIYNNTDLNSK